MSTTAPDSIRFNAIDRYYLVPETEDLDGTYFPMSLVGAIRMRTPLSADQLLRGLYTVNTKYPQMRLAYSLDYRQIRWRRVPDEQLDAHFRSLIHRVDTPGSLTILVAAALSSNNQPLSHPIHFELHGNVVLFKGLHSFGDGRLMARLIPYIILAAVDPGAFEALPPLPVMYSTPLWRAIMRSPARAARMYYNTLRLLPTTIREYRGSEGRPTQQPALEPIRSGSPLHVVNFTCGRETILAFSSVKSAIIGHAKVSLNTIFQVSVAYRLMQIGLQTRPIVYTTPIDLGQYFGNSDFYAGNLAGQSRVQTGDQEPASPIEECLALQRELDRQLRQEIPLSSFPLEWLLALAGDDAYRNTNRQWLLSGPATDPRVFIVSNIGGLGDLERIAPYFDASQGVALCSPLMGGPPLLVIVGFLGRQLLVSIISDPRRVTDEQVEQLRLAFDPVWIRATFRVKTPPATP
ncbi:MAG TPA: hypothetical protein VMT34_14285 [Aggregatilineales bacterium]|nr:hypothetical protein [Aggregatilineales bacterium]